MGLFGTTNREILEAVTLLQEDLLAQRRQMLAGFRRLNKQLHRVERTVRRLSCQLRRDTMARIVPGPLFMQLQGEILTMLTFQIQLPAPPPAPNDIQHGELLVEIAGITLPVFILDPHVTVFADQLLKGNDNDQVHLDFSYVDDADNRSQSSLLDVLLVDTIAPAEPGGLGLLVTGEDFESLPEQPSEGLSS